MYGSFRYPVFGAALSLSAAAMPACSLAKEALARATDRAALQEEQVTERANALIAQMTPEEKAAQLTMMQGASVQG